MAISLNGVVVSREAGCLIPTSIITRATVSSGCTINALKLDSGDISTYKDLEGNLTSSEIAPNPGNLPIIPNGAWSLNTVLYANFNGDLEAGPLSLYGAEVDAIAVRRSSNRSNFKIWEDVRIINNVKNVIDNTSSYYFSDKNIESGILYLYAIQPMSGDIRGSLYKGARRVAIFEDGFLVGEGGRQLKLRFNSNVSSIKRVIKDTRVETIGSKYPFVTRNSNVGYREFSLSGTITHFMDETKEFAPRAEMFIDSAFADNGPVFDMTQEYNGIYASYGLNDYNNTVLEREFRNKVQDFLQDGKPKLFKSPTEGNMIVRVLDVSLSPNQSLGRLISDFSCTVVEIDDYTVENIEKHGIQER